MKQEIIIRYTREGKSQREISRELKISRKTVKKYIESYFVPTSGSRGWSGSAKSKPNDSPKLYDHLSVQPKYNCRNRGRRILNTEIQQEIKELLGLNTKKRREGLHKQVLKKCDIHMALQEKGFRVGYTTVCNYSEQEKRSSEAVQSIYRSRSKSGMTPRRSLILKLDANRNFAK